MESLYLVDGTNLLFRAYHAMPPMTTSQGTETGALVGFVNMLLRLEDAYHPSHIAVVFDAGGKSVRTDVYAAYKAHRPKCPPDLLAQMDGVSELVALLGYRVLQATHVEADDVIATLARQGEVAGMKVVIVSSDKDLMQLCGDHVVMLDTMKQNNAGVTYGPREVQERFGVLPSQLGDVLALMGDTSDNIPGVPGIGPKTAAQLIQQFGSLDALLSRVEEIRGRGAERIQAALSTHREQIGVARQLVTLHENVPLAVDVHALNKQPIHAETLRAALRRYELQRLFRRFFPEESWVPRSEEPRQAQGGIAPGAWLDVPASPPENPTPEKRNKPTLVVQAVAVLETEAQWQAWWRHVEGLSQPVVSLAVQFAGWQPDPVARTTPVCGVALAAEDLSGTTAVAPVYLPLGHLYLGAGPQWSAAAFVQVMQQALSRAGMRWVTLRAKETTVALQRAGLEHIPVFYNDPALCAYLIDAANAATTRTLVQQWLHVEGTVPASREETSQGGRKPVGWETIEVERVAAWAGLEAQALLALGRTGRARLSPAAVHLLDTVELPLAGILAQMERSGILIDIPVLQQLSAQMGITLRRLEEEVQAVAGYAVNIHSPKQLQELLFEKLQLTPSKKTKTGHSTDAEVLELLADQHPIVQAILTHRTLAKLKNTYLDQIPVLVDPRTGRLHTRYHQTATATGRLSSTEPNVQNIPIRGEWGIPIRRAFVAPHGQVLVSADYSQIELRILAHLSQDPILMESFLQGEDIHQRTAIEMFGPTQGTTSAMRRVAKMINYGILYGLSEHGLAARLSIDRKVARAYIHNYFARYTRVQAFLNELVVRARKEGGLGTLLGRFRPLPELHAPNYQTRAAGERMAKNTPIQGTAADVLKLAMVHVQQALDAHPELDARMLLTVHDELVFEVPASQQAALCTLVKDRMERAYQLDVPLVVDVHAGATWADCK